MWRFDRERSAGSSGSFLSRLYLTHSIPKSATHGEQQFRATLPQQSPFPLFNEPGRFVAISSGVGGAAIGQIRDNGGPHHVAHAIHGCVAHVDQPVDPDKDAGEFERQAE